MLVRRKTLISGMKSPPMRRMSDFASESSWMRNQGVPSGLLTVHLRCRIPAQKWRL